jgi:hypothetical protein
MRLRLVAALCVAGTGALAADKPTRFWNLTTVTITSLSLAPAGTERWGRNQCENDRDGEVDPRERLPITGVAPGRYDVRMTDKGGRVCLARAVEVRDGAVFTLADKDLAECTR